MPANVGRAHRRAVVLTAAIALVVSLGVVAQPGAAVSLPAIEEFDVAAGAEFPVDAFSGEREAVASDALLLSDPTSGVVFERVTNAEGTTLTGDVRGDEPQPSLGQRPMIVPSGVTDAGRITAAFVERTLELDLVGQGSSGSGPMLQLASPGDAAGYSAGATTLAAPVDQPVTGETYVISPRDVLEYTTPPSGVAALTNTPTIGFNPMQVRGVPDLGNPESQQQWTVLGQGEGPEGLPQFQLVNRNDGACLTVGGLDANFTFLETDVCDSTIKRQLWQVRELPDGFGPGYNLYSVGDRGWMWADGGISTQQAEGQASLNYQVQENEFFSWGWQWRKVQQSTPIPAAVSLPAEDRADYPFDLAVGDVDNARDANVLPRDEAVVAHAAEGELLLSVVDYNADENALLVSTLETGQNIGSAASGGEYSPIAVNLADLDGDGIAEIVATYATTSGVFALVARYSVTPDGARALELVGSPVSLGIPAPSGASYSADAGVADLDGDGVQEIAWAGANSSSGNEPTLWTASIAVTDGVATGGRESVTGLGAGAVPLADGAGLAARVRVETGQFQAQLAGSGIRQVAVTWEDTGGTWVDVLAAYEGQSTASRVFPEAVRVPQVAGSGGVTLAVGGFANAGGADNASWGIAVSAVGGSGTGNAVTLVQPIEPGQAPAVQQLAVAPSNGSTLTRPGWQVTAYDPAGASLVLGDPLVFTVEELVKLSLVAGQPPAHSDWLNGGFVNISRNQDFSLTMGDSSSVSYQNGTSQESNQTYDLTGLIDISGTAKFGVPFLEKTKVSADIAAKIGGAWEKIRTSLQSLGSSQSKTINQKTQDDDIVNAIVQDYRVYRYPVLSVETWGRTDAATSGCDTGCYGFWDVVVPGDPVPVFGSGKSFDFFEPAWQNGNALSYPQLVNGKVPLTDVGPFTYTDANGTTQTSDAPLVNDQFVIGGTSSTETLDVSQTTGTGSSEKSSSGWNLGFDAKGSASAKVKVPFESLKLGLQLGIGFNTNQTFTDSSTGQTDNSHASTFGIEVPEVDSNRGYAVGAAYFYGNDGAPRVSYGVDLTADAESREWWLTNYGVNADPALNLPYASILTYDQIEYLGVPEWNPLASRQEIRGFTARMPYSDEATTSGAVYASGPGVGDPVVFDVEVSNYSLASMGEELTVDFMAVPVDANGLKVTGDPISIGRTTVDRIDPQSSVTVSSPQWTAVGSESGGAQNYRVFVVLDQDDSVTEIHEWAGTPATICPSSSVQDEAELIDPMTGDPETLTCGQNNQGYGLVSVYPASDVPETESASAARAAVASAEPTTPSLVGAGVLTRDEATLHLTGDSAAPTVTAGHATTVLLRADGPEDSRDHQTVVVYDGDPADGEVVAVTTMRGVRADGTSVASFTYVPEEEGTHELRAVLLGGTSSGDGLLVRMNAVSDAEGGDGGSGTDGGAGAGGNGEGTASGGDLATTGTDGGAWLWLGLVGILLAAAGAVLVSRRNRHRRQV
ncbi:hypothetical protein [Microbacterium sp. SLBN-146]|uniref:hypothetical protein n=1 Tax=Microbacterium sp. SLBN-146 TaxID=2768457 RepID=UPI001153E919|nr:hypothetical protein [Microbacterium sp. SLBN-146]TQJ30805.1 hypothetical protein FBY39_1262 [Microbacterium sp. SLBN-146]